MLAKKLPLTEILREAVANTTAHAICRVAPANRNSKLRIFWLLAFLCFVGLMLRSSISYVDRLTNPGVKSVFQAEEVEFQFPDVYFCNSLQAAGSFIYLLNETEVEQALQPIGIAYSSFIAALRSLNATAKEVATLSNLLTFAVVQSLPYKVWADIIGQRKLQTFYRNYGIFSVASEPLFNSPVQVETLYHPNHMNCFKLALSEPELEKMRNTNNRLRFDLLLDPYLYDFQRLGLYTNASLHNLPPLLYNISSSHTMLIYPFDWNLENPVEIDRGSGMYLYLTPRGHYPSKFTTNVVSLGPGRAYDIAIRMSDSQFTPSDFPNHCVDKHEPVQFFNPYNGGADIFNYSEAFCYYTEIAKDMLQRYNCSSSPQPLPWQFRHLRLCVNLTGIGSESAAVQNMRAFVSARDTGGKSSNWDQLCSTKKLCLQRTYSVTSSYGLWPNQASIIRLVRNILGSLLETVDTNEFRSLNTGLKTLQHLDPEDLIGYEHGASRYFQRAIVRVTLRAEATRSSLTTFSLDYGFAKFIADMGSALGLYLGCSLVTLLELLELMHDAVMYGSCRMKRFAQ